MPKPIAVQLYTLRDLCAKDFAGVVKNVARMGYTAVEFAGLYNMTAKDVRKLLDGEGLNASSAHSGIFDPAQWQKVEDEARTLGYDKLVSGFGPDDFKTDERVKAAAAKVNAAINHFGPKGFTIHLHNHEFEFAMPKGEMLYELCPKVFLELDIYWAQVGGRNPVEVVQRYASRIQLMHVKDGPANPKDRGLPMTAVGAGKVDIPGCIRAGEYGALEWPIVELDICATDMTEAVRQSYNYLTGRSLATGKR